jgi:hypothetical protein
VAVAGLAYRLDLLEGEAVCLARLQHPLRPSVIERRHPEIDSTTLLGLRVAPTYGRCLRGGSDTVTRHGCQHGAACRLEQRHGYGIRLRALELERGQRETAYDIAESSCGTNPAIQPVPQQQPGAPTTSV